MAGGGGGWIVGLGSHRFVRYNGLGVRVRPNTDAAFTDN